MEQPDSGECDEFTKLTIDIDDSHDGRSPFSQPDIVLGRNDLKLADNDLSSPSSVLGATPGSTEEVFPAVTAELDCYHDGNLLFGKPFPKFIERTFSTASDKDVNDNRSVIDKSKHYPKRHSFQGLVLDLPKRNSLPGIPGDRPPTRHHSTQHLLPAPSISQALDEYALFSCYDERVHLSVFRNSFRKSKNRFKRSLQKRLNAVTPSDDGSYLGDTCVSSGVDSKSKLLAGTTFRKGKQHVKYQWDVNCKGANIDVIENKSKIIRRKGTPSTDAARGAIGFNSGKHVFQFLFNEAPWGSYCSVGVVMKYADLSMSEFGHLLGKDEFSWGWDLPSRQLIHNGKIADRVYPTTDMIIPRCITMILDMEKGELSFMINEKDLGVAFTDLQSGKLQDYELYPACSCVFTNMEVKLVVVDSSFLVRKPKGDETEKEEIKLEDICISKLTDRQHHLLEVSHGWDQRKKAFKLYSSIPNNPCICHVHKDTYTTDNYENVLGIRSRRGFTTGIHTWEIREEQMYTSTVSFMELDFRHNDLVVGISTEDFDDYYDGKPHKVEMLKYVHNFWGWRHLTKQLYNDQYHDELYAQNVPKTLHAMRGITAILDCDKGEMSFEYEGEDLGIAFKNLPHVKLYPTVLYITGYFPVSLTYLDGPKDYLHDFIHDTEKMALTVTEYQTLLGYKSWLRPHWLQLEMASDKMKDKFTWDRDTIANTVFGIDRRDPKWLLRNAVIHNANGGRSKNVSNSDPVRGKIPVVEGFHIWTYTFSQILGTEDHYLIGIVNEHYYDTDYVSVDRNLYVWLWDIVEGTLYHGSRQIARYPVYPLDFEPDRYYRFQLVMDLENNYRFGFTALAPHIPMELGIAFDNLPEGRYYPCLMYKSGELDCKLEYIEGPSEFIRNHDKLCCEIQ